MRGRADGSFLGVGIRLGSLGLGCTGLGGLLELGFEGEGEGAGLGCVVSDSVSQSVRYFYVDEPFMSMEAVKLQLQPIQLSPLSRCDQSRYQLVSAAQRSRSSS